VLGRKR